MTRQAAVVVVVLAGVHVMCGGTSPSAPSGGSPSPSPSASPVISVTGVSPAVGSTAGGTILTISGDGFLRGATVTLDNEVRPAWVENQRSIQITTQARAAGGVDVVVTNTGGQPARLASAYTYASPATFDFNGTWAGAAVAHPEVDLPFGPHHSDMELQFSVSGNRISSFTCGYVETVFSPPRAVTNGEFSFTGTDGLKISGKIVSASGAVGTIDTGDCPGTRWSAKKQ